MSPTIRELLEEACLYLHQMSLVSHVMVELDSMRFDELSREVGAPPGLPAIAVYACGATVYCDVRLVPSKASFMVKPLKPFRPLDTLDLLGPWRTAPQQAVAAANKAPSPPPAGGLASGASLAGRMPSLARPGFTPPTAPAEPQPQLSGALEVPRCECGSEKVGFPGHSSWCPKGSA